MIAFPNCKINLGLNITGKRSDGYHNLETVFYPVALKDALEIIPSTRFGFNVTGLPVAGDTKDNLCVKAYDLLKGDFPGLPAVTIHLHKVVPMGAGLGGGSANGAFMLVMLNNMFNLGLSDYDLIFYALQLGSDCPFFIQKKPCFATGRGEILTIVPLDLSGFKVVVVSPAIHVSTRDAFARLTPATPKKSTRHIIEQPIATWKDELVNDFEKPVFTLYPEIADIKESLYSSGALYASMTGSGSAVFALFDIEADVSFSFPTHYSYAVL